jgi:SecD/SecF fusion protein
MLTRRNLTGLFVMIVLIGALMYLWQPWRPADEARLRPGLDLQGGLRVVLQADEPPVREDLVAARRVIENRVNQFGVAEPLIQTSGDDRIVVELPGLTSEEQERALDIIGQQAILEFRIVRPGATDPLTLTDLEPAAFTGEILRGAQADFARGPGGTTLGGAVVLFEVRGEFADDFGRFTAQNVGQRMAIVLDDTIMSAPTIQSRISDSGQITGMADLQEASDLALVLRSGSLPISLHVQEIRAVGPTLGADSVRSGTLAALVGAGLVVITILLYYGPLFGGVLVVGLLFVMLIVFGALAGLGAVITLPGLAGLVLTIGAAVDGNVISFERIKEELREGKSLRLAMRGGFANSLSAIIDANVTTLLAAATLYQYMTGPVRGFAITLAIGLIAAVFVNTVVVPFMLDVLTLRFKKPRMPRGFYVTGIDFVKKAPIVMAISGALAIGAIIVVSVKDLNLSTDFTGGINTILTVPDAVGVSDVRGAIDALDIPGVSGGTALVQEVQATAGEDREMSVRVGLVDDAAALERFPGALAAALGGSVLQADFVGPAIGEELRGAAFAAVLVAFGMILFYVGWRFWPTWIVAIAAVLAVAHDVGIVMGILDLVGAEFSIPVLAAILFVVGYSLNDSIIVADRIRENLRRIRGSDYASIVNLSVNQTLSRTVLTSGTTLLPVLSLLFLGGSVLRDFSFTLLLGIAIGTYSSIFILAPLVVWFKSWQLRRPRRRPAARAA